MLLSKDKRLEVLLAGSYRGMKLFQLDTRRSSDNTGGRDKNLQNDLEVQNDAQKNKNNGVRELVLK